MRIPTVALGLLALAAFPGWAADTSAERAEAAAARAEAAAQRSEAAAARAEGAINRLEHILDEQARRDEARRRPGTRRSR